MCYTTRGVNLSSQVTTNSNHRKYLARLLLYFFLASSTLYGRILMWSLPWTPWASWSSQDKEPEEVKKQTKAGEGQRSQRGVKYYQRSKSEKSANIDETAGMDKRKVKPPGGAKRASGDQQQGDSTELVDEWQVVREEELQVISTCKHKGRNSSILGYVPDVLVSICI